MDSDRAGELIARERARIEAALTELGVNRDDSELSHLDQHLADAGSELYEREQAAGQLARLRDELAAVERAEKRLEEGSYGVSIVSGEPIPDARLEANPTAERTIEEQQRYES